MEAVIEAINAGSEELLRQAIIPLVQGGYIEEYKQAIATLTENVTPSALTINTIREIITMVQEMEDYSIRVDFYAPLKDYLYTSPNFAEELQFVHAAFVEACHNSERYYDMGVYYESIQLDEEQLGEWDALEHHLTIAECFQRCRIIEKANKHLIQANKDIFRLRTPKELLERFDMVRAYLSIDKSDYRQAVLSFLLLSGYSSADQLQWLRSAIACAILTEAGPKRQALFVQIMSDERSRTLPVFSLLERLNQKQLIMVDDLKEFEEELSCEYGFNVAALHNSVRMHNLHAISRLYSSISIDRLAEIIGGSSAEVMQTVKTMIQTKRLKAKIDQPTGLIIYEDEVTADAKKDMLIESFCKNVAETAKAISTE